MAPAFAQTADSTAGPEALQEVIVTAQHRMENLQDVPISAQVIGGQVLSEQNLNSLTELSHTVPSVHVGAVGRSTELYIRGIGSGPNQFFDQSVGLFIDDIYHGRSRVSVGTFLDLDRVEILKGPQSTFFGNNAIAGAYNIVTKKPGDTFEGSVRALYGEDGQYAVEGAGGGPVTEKFGIRAAATFNGQDGWLDNVNTGRSVPQEHSMAGRVTFAFKPNDDLDATLKIDGSRYKNDSGLVLQFANCPPPAPFVRAGFCATALNLGLPIGFDTQELAQSGGQQIKLHTFEDVLTINYQKWNHTFTSVSGYYDYQYDLNLDTDGLPATLIHAQLPESYHQFSQEFRVASATGQTLEYLAGVYFQTDYLRSRTSFNYGFLTPVVQSLAPFAALVPYLPLGQDINYRQGEDVYSVFGSATWNVTDRLNIVGGLRTSQVKKNYDWNLFYATATQPYGGNVPLPSAVATLPAALGLGTPNTLSDDRSDHALMPSAKIQYKIDTQAMVYLSYARGFKAGGFNGVDNSGNAANLPFSPEHVNAYEAGLKSEWFNNRVLLNLSLFRSDYSDLQVSTNILSSAGTFVSLVKNAASSRSQGVEFEAQWAASEHFRLAAAATYLDAKYESYPNATPTQLQTFRGLKVQDLSGRPTAFAPRWSGSATATYSLPLPGDYLFTTELSSYFSSSYDVGGIDDPLVRTDSYTRLDARVSLESPDRRWAFDVIGKNLTDASTFVFGPGPLPRSPGSLFFEKEQPRNFAVQGRYRW